MTCNLTENRCLVQSHSSTSLKTPMEFNRYFPSHSLSSSLHLASMSPSDSNVIKAVPNKRPSMLVNRFMKHIQMALKDLSGFSSDINDIPNSSQDDQTESKSTKNEAAVKRVYVKILCYLNAASCFY